MRRVVVGVLMVMVFLAIALGFWWFGRGGGTPPVDARAPIRAENAAPSPSPSDHPHLAPVRPPAPADAAAAAMSADFLSQMGITDARQVACTLSEAPSGRIDVRGPSVIGVTRPDGSRTFSLSVTYDLGDAVLRVDGYAPANVHWHPQGTDGIACDPVTLD